MEGWLKGVWGMSGEEKHPKRGVLVRSALEQGKEGVLVCGGSSCGFGESK